MKLLEHVYLVGSGAMGFGLSDGFDCHVYLIDGGDELALVDAGAGMAIDAIVENVRADGFDVGKIRHLVLTHAHGDHAGGAALMRRALEAPGVYLSRVVADHLRSGDERSLSVDVAKKAGIYPADYHLEPCEVDVELAEGDVVRIGDVALRVFETPGHCDGHVSLLLEADERRVLFAGDAVFFGGKILLQNIHDCRLDATIASLRKLRGLDVTALLPGHLAVALTGGQAHIERANELLDRLLIPEQIVSAW